VSEPSEQAFRRMLEEKGLKLDEKAFSVAMEGARHLKAEVARLAKYLQENPDKRDD
jgi:hypothetical protein